MNKIIGTAHIQVKDETNASQIHRITRKISFDIFKEFGIILTIGIYASNDDKEYKELREYINDTIKEYDSITQIHAFYVDDQDKNVSFDLIFSFDELNPEKIVSEITDKLKKKFPEYEYIIIIDTDFND